MTIARANWRAVSASTLAIAGPSRRCRWQSSGRLSVTRSIAAILLCPAFRPVERFAIQLALRDTGNASRQLRGLAWRECAEQHVEHALGVDAAGRTLLARRQHQHELALLAFFALVEPRRCGGERHARDFLELLAELARDNDLPFGAGVGQQAIHRFAYALRRLVQHDRPRQVQRLQRLAPGGRLGRQEAGEQEAARGEGRRRDRGRRGAWARPRADRRAGPVRLRGAPGPGDGERWRARVAN